MLRQMHTLCLLSHLNGSGRLILTQYYVRSQGSDGDVYGNYAKTHILPAPYKLDFI